MQSPLQLALILAICITAVLPAVRYVPKWKKQACEVPASQNAHSHYVCDDDGELRCLPGWTGDLCDVPKCRPGCDPLQGYCKRPGECRCKLGFYGEHCNKCIPLPGCQHGICNVSFECQCLPGWDGIFCSEPLCRSDCHPARGYCEAPNECRCRLGWQGRNCTECQTLPGCRHGTCRKPLECRCKPGYTGILCQTPICAANCDRERGTCRRPGECRCRLGWTGPNCTQCHPYPGCSKEHGSCIRPWECRCEQGWGGMLCDEELNYCEKNPDTCGPGRCVSRAASEGSYECFCPPGTYPPNCLTIDNSTITEGPSDVGDFPMAAPEHVAISSPNYIPFLERPVPTDQPVQIQLPAGLMSSVAGINKKKPQTMAQQHQVFIVMANQGSNVDHGSKRPIPLTNETAKQNVTTTPADNNNKTMTDDKTNDESSEIPNLSQEIPSLDKEKENFVKLQNVDDVSQNEA
ncbi:delta-like protein C [Ctenocephalides felis]|uniref:delta-like protein C n=1 Tax=Ctenocephalides felis TaxID=7515 RepID=UPI000E6E5013|nr:delta-like protein C [Ctenocephalides felis]